MFTPLALTLLSALAAVHAVSEKCTNELEGIVYEPKTYARDYMTKVAANFNLGKAALFTPQADSYIQSFEQEWGVTLEIFDASNICTTNSETVCSAVQQGFPNGTSVFNLTSIEDYTISSLQITFEGSPQGNGGLGSYNMTSPAGTTIILSSDNICVGNTNSSAFNIGFADDGTTETSDCPADQDAGTVFIPTQPLSTFNGESAMGNWIFMTGGNLELNVNLITFAYCQINSNYTCTRDAMKALTNIPGFRYDSGTQTVYYTEDVFDNFGNFKQVTIIRPINGIFVKK